jgi:mannose-6-phosphate isomerase
LVALAMNVVRLEPGEACFTSDGIVHSYQSGVGLEIMANSDNVIRAGLTPKHIDVDALLEVSVLTPTAPARILPTPAGDAAAYRPPAEEFGLLIVDDGEVETPPGPRIVLGLEGQTRVSTDAGSLVLSKGAAVFVPHADGGARVRSTGKAAVALVP